MRLGAAGSALDIWLPGKEKVLCEGMGYKGWSFPPEIAQTTTLTTATANNAALYGILVPLLVGEVVTNLYFELGTAPTLLSVAKMAIFSSDGQTRHAITADFATDLNSKNNQIYGAALSPSAFTVPATGVYWFTYLNMGTAGATIKRANLLNNARLKTGGVLRTSFVQNAYADTPTTFTPAGITSAIWMAWD